MLTFLLSMADCQCSIPDVRTLLKKLALVFAALAHLGGLKSTAPLTRRVVGIAGKTKVSRRQEAIGNFRAESGRR
jgi:L-asparaginase II